jgi:hypothetical protein
MTEAAVRGEIANMDLDLRPALAHRLWMERRDRALPKNDLDDYLNKLAASKP